MSDKETGGVERPKTPEKIRQSDEYLAVVSNGARAFHIVRTATFDNTFALNLYDSEAYGGQICNIGDAESLCGHEARGRMLPEDVVDRDDEVCGNCLRALRAKVDNGDGIRTDGASRYVSADDGSPLVRCQNCGHEESMASRPHNTSVRDCPDCDDPQLEAVLSDTASTEGENGDEE